MTKNNTARESRLEARLIVLGFDNVDELDEYIYRNGAAQLIPSLQNQETQETQFNLDPQQKLERYKKVRIDMRTMKELLKTKDKEEEYLKKLLKAEQEKTGDRLRELELLRGEIERLRRNSGTFEDSSLLKVELEEKSVRLQISNDHNTLLSAEVDSL